ncbi:CRISPR-associated ring nuclease Csm6 [Puniceibacterium sediminis]|uniref:CRISPR-associated protein, NE0113 family n=1 Tax=Puniceibacterium sediminis TaxID=1608407 RepID=A0A238WFZ1_9RHOB|nr:CRISPR-associated ring nuclease Csm6 [Puniceibacterium sediminis]SNR44599.1 CRISPR-associated protein, NE0113 family [Puniceibacterium sediminis]
MTFDRRILLATVGMSPAVVTETLWALQNERQSQSFPTEVHFATTTTGATKIEEHFLKGSIFRDFAKQYDLDIKISAENIHIVHGKSGPLANIQTDDDNMRLADLVVNLVRDFTKDPASSLHVSIAGGRKTMTFFGGYILSLFSRPQDRLSHVLVDPRFEIPGFFFPPHPPADIDVRGGRASTKDAGIVLADIPILRLRGFLRHNPMDGDLSYSDIVALAQRLIDPPEMVVDIPNRKLICQGVSVDFSSATSQFALAIYLAKRIVDEGKMYAGAISHEEFLDPSEQSAFQQAQTLAAGTRDDIDRLQEKLADRGHAPLREVSFLSTRTRLNERLDLALADLADRYKIHRIATKPKAARGFRLEPHQITILED